MANEVMAKKDTGSIALFGNDAAKGFEHDARRYGVAVRKNPWTIITTGN